jgi:hypothetical protein
MNAFTSAYGSDILNESIPAQRVYGPGIQLGLEFYLDRNTYLELDKDRPSYLFKKSFIIGINR